jgi:hypothetical protein
MAHSTQPSSDLDQGGGARCGPGACSTATAESTWWTPSPPAWPIAAQIAELRARGGNVETIFPDDHSLTAFGVNMMDLSTRPPAARAGYDRGTALAVQLTDFWR